MQTDKPTAASPLELDWRTIANAIPNASVIQDPAGKILAANSAFMRLMKLSNDPTGSFCGDIIRWSDDSCPAPTSNASMRTELYVAPIGLHAVVMSSDISGVATIHTLTDISELRKAYIERIASTEQILSRLRARDQELQNGRDAFFNMFEDISESYMEMEDLFMSLLRAMVGALDAKSPWTRGHSERVARFTENIARAMGLEDEMISDIRLGGLLHDIGKIGTYDALLDKPGALTAEEFEVIKKHPAQGASIIQNIKQLRVIVPFIRHHHERYDGRGYPDGLKGEEIPLQARILHAADSFDAMTSSRPYRVAPGVIHAMKEFERYGGIQFDPDVAHAFLALFEKQPDLFM